MEMTSDLDIFRSANLLVKRHGEDATFKCVVKATEELLRTEPGPGASVQ